jgi:hypothetical protein
MNLDMPNVIDDAKSRLSVMELKFNILKQLYVDGGADNNSMEFSKDNQIDDN